MNGVLADGVTTRHYIPQQAESSLETVYNRYVDQVYRQCLSMTKDSEKAQDFTHDIFIKVFHKLDAFEQRSSLSTWINSIAYNYCADQLRLAKRLQTTSLDEELNGQVSESQEAALQEEATQLVNQALASLSKAEQVLLRQKYEEGISLDELAQMHQLSLSAVKMRLKRSREKIQRFCAQQQAT
ncbi:RNA polymerase sigma factor [Spirosoma validum]|uniref:RNA polymerase sigma factor n=1 Tax=Spirosoma validum TaxID=2771355 RepID=A0A927B224_9BACT|nr:RNA polymerase sigma factor [Spirosoma validum]MBD2754144.1 RNA polymerase sigma factor [Spirosoma validum]